MSDKASGNLSDRYHDILGRVHAACARSGRSPDEVTVVAVSKTFSSQHIQALYDLGHRHFGENKVQELVMKDDYLKSVDSCPGILWHLIGHLQRNKVRSVIDHIHLFHGLDSARLAEELDRRVSTPGNQVQCLVQVNISGEDSKFGIDPEMVSEFIEVIGVQRNISIVGLMGMARPVANPEETRGEFVLLRQLRDELLTTRNQASSCRHLSMGMSQDFEVAIEEGATIVRIGSAIFGGRDIIPD